MTDLLAKAQQLTDKDRHDAYGPASVNLQRIADAWSAYLGRTLAPHDVALLMVIAKAIRCAHKPSHDNLVDIAGYAKLADQVRHGPSRNDA